MCMTYRRWPARTHPPTTPHPALAHTKRASELLGLSRGQRDSRYIRLSDGLWLDRRSSVDVASLAIAYQRLYPGSVLSGWSALALHGFTAPGTARPELWIGRSARRRKGLVVRRYQDLPEPEIRHVRGVLVCSIEWAAFDLSRFLPRDDAVIALEGMYAQGFDLSAMHPLLKQQAGTWGIRRALEAYRSADPASQSPMETRTRLILDDAGITGFEAQVEEPALGYFVDLGHRFAKVAIEYDGDDHFDATRHRRDVRRINRLRAEGWEVITVTYDILMNHRDEFLRQVRRALERRGVRLAA